MLWREWIYYAYCALVLFVPVKGTLSNTLNQQLTFFLSFPQFHFFRAYVASGPSANKTVVHSLVIVLTYLIQLMLCHLYFLSILGCFQDSMLYLLHNYPGALCLLASPWPYGHATLLYLMFLAIFGLLTVAETNLFLKLDHDFLTSTINLSSTVYIVVYILMNFITGSLCVPRAANIFISARMGIETDIGNLTDTLRNSPGVGSGFPIYMIVIIAALIFYIASFIIKKKQIWKQMKTDIRQNNGLNIISSDSLDLDTDSTNQDRMPLEFVPADPKLICVRPIPTPSLLLSETASAPKNGVLLDGSRLPTSTLIEAALNKYDGQVDSDLARMDQVHSKITAQMDPVPAQNDPLQDQMDQVSAQIQPLLMDLIPAQLDKTKQVGTTTTLGEFIANSYESTTRPYGSSSSSVGYSTSTVGSTTIQVESTTNPVGSTTNPVGSNTIEVRSTKSQVGSSAIQVGPSTIQGGFTTSPYGSSTKKVGSTTSLVGSTANLVGSTSNKEGSISSSNRFTTSQVESTTSAVGSPTNSVGSSISHNESSNTTSPDESRTRQVGSITSPDRSTTSQGSTTRPYRSSKIPKVSTANQVGYNSMNNQVNPLTPSNPVTQSTPKSKLARVFDKISFSLGLALFYMIIMYTLSPGRSTLANFSVRLGYKYVFECLPMYWVLMVDDCYQLACRRTKAWVNNVFGVII